MFNSSLEAITRRLSRDHGSSWLYPDSAYTYWDRCPAGFVFPDDPTHPRNNYIGNSSCATACRLPFWTPNDYRNFDNMALYSSIFGMILFPILFFPALKNFLRLPTEAKVQKKSYGLILLMVAMSGGTTFALALSPFTNDKTNMFCLNNAVPRRQDDGVSFCVAQGVLVTYFPLGFMISWVCQCIDIYMKVVLRIKSTAKYNGYFVGASVLFPMLSVLVVALGDHEYGYSGQEQYCLVPPPLPGVVNYLYYVFDVPSYACVLVGVFCLSAILLKFYRAWLTSRKLAAAEEVARLSNRASSAVAGSANPSMQRRKQYSFLSSVIVRLSCTGGGQRVQPGGITSSNRGRQGKNLGGASQDEEDESNNRSLDAASSKDFFARRQHLAVQAVENDDEDETDRTTSVEDNEKGRAMRDMNNVKALTTPIIGCLLFGLYWAISALSNIPGIISAQEDYNTKEAWIECVFSNFDGVSDDTWIDVCGIQPETYMGSAKQIQALFVIASFGQSLLVFLVYCKLVFFPARKVALPREYVHMVRRAISSAARRQNGPPKGLPAGPAGATAAPMHVGAREEDVRRRKDDNIVARAPSYVPPPVFIIKTAAKAAGGRGGTVTGGGGTVTGGGGSGNKKRRGARNSKAGNGSPSPSPRDINPGGHNNQDQGGGSGAGGSGRNDVVGSGTPGQDRVVFFKPTNQNGGNDDGNENHQQHHRQQNNAVPGTTPRRTTDSKPDRGRGGGQITNSPRSPQHHVILPRTGENQFVKAVVHTNAVAALTPPSVDRRTIGTPRQTAPLLANPSPPARVPLVEVIAEAFAHDPAEAAAIVGNGVGNDSSSSMYVVHGGTAGGGTAGGGINGGIGGVGYDYSSGSSSAGGLKTFRPL